MIFHHFVRKGTAAAIVLGLTAVTAEAQFFTGPYGPGGAWNLYQVVTVPATYPNARTAARNKTAASTGLPGMTSTVTGHLVQIGSQDENTFIAAVTALTPGAGNSNIWLGLNDLDAPDGPGEKGAARTGWRWADAEDQLDSGDFAPWAPGEPNNSGGVEDGVEMRVDGSWNDANITGARRYVIEWELRAPGPVPGAAPYPVYYTGPYGAGGTWNLYRIVMHGESWDSARAAARAATAKSTGLSGVSAAAYGALTGHLVSLNTEAEHHFVYQAMAFGGLNTIGYWTGGTDRVSLGGDGQGADPLTGWKWADETSGQQHLTYHHFPRRPFFAMAEPGDTGGLEDVIEVTGTGHWNDTNGSMAATLRRYVVEWNTEMAAPVGGAAQLAPMLSGVRGFTGTVSTGQWNVKGTVFSSKPLTLNNITAALAYVNTPPPTAFTQEVTLPVLSCTDSNPPSFTTGRSTYGLFWPRQPLANDTAGVDDDHYLVNGRTRIHCEAGTTYTINVHSDDGFYLRLTGSGGGRAVFSKIGGLGGIDQSDGSAIYFVYGTSDSSTRGVFSVSDTGVYDVEYVGFDGTGGSFQEVSWAPVEALNDWDTGEWRLMGGTPPGAPQLPPVGVLSGPAGTGRKWGTRAAASAAVITGIPDAVAAIQSAASPVEEEFPVINYNDPNNAGNRFRFAGDFPLPGNTGADDNQFVVAAKTDFQVPAAGPCTICVRADDNFALRVTGQKWAGRVISYTATTVSATGNGFVDPLDPSTLFWMPSSDTNARAVINFPAAGRYALEFLHYEGTGGAGAEIYFAPGILASDADSTEWKLIGETSAYTPVLPATLPGGTDGRKDAWGLQVLEPAAASVNSVATAVAALQNGTGVNHRDTVPVLNHIVAASPGTGGIFGGDLELPGIDAENNANLAIRARAAVIVPAAGLYTFFVRSADGWALRFKNQTWLDRSSAGIDPADPSTLIHNVTGAPGAVNDFRGGGVIFLNQGSHEVDFITFQDQRDTQFEVYAAAGNLIGTADTALIGTANLGDAGPGAAWRLVGHQSQDIFPRLGVISPWTVRQTRPQATAYAGSGGIAGATAWLDQPAGTNGLITGHYNMINFNDPGFGGPGNMVNDAPIPWNNTGTAADDNYFATRMEATLRVPADGYYSIGWQGDDGGFFEFLNPPVPVEFNRLVGNAMLGGTIGDSTDGTPKGRIQLNAGGGNTRTIGEILLPAGDYPVRALWFEGQGSAYFEIFAAAPEQQYHLITTTSGTTATSPADTDGLRLGPMPPPAVPIEIIRVSFPASRVFSFTWTSVPGKTYQVQRSADLSAWVTIVPAMASGGGATTTYTSPAALPAGETRYYYRVREAPP
ncbi:MAG: C-type lectin domain-containing protein [Verrucomicrobiota bacterium]